MSDSTLKTSSSRTVWLVGLLISAVSGIVAVGNGLKSLKETDPIFWKIFYIFLLCLLGAVTISCFIGVVFYKWLNKKYNEYQYKKQRINSDFLLNHVKVCIEYITDDGGLVSIQRDEHIINIKSSKTSSTVFETEGEFIEPYGISCAFTPLSKNRLRTYSLLDATRIEKGGEYYSSYSLIAKNGFTNSTEYWIFGVSNFCRIYELQVIIPSRRKILNAYLLFKEVKEETEKESNGIDLIQSGWIDYDEPCIMRTQKHDVTVITVQLSSFNEEHRYKLVWELA